MTETRAHRAPLAPAAAAAALRQEARDGAVDPDCAEAVLVAAGHVAEPQATTAGLTTREIEVLRLVARGLTTKQVARELGIALKTADRHIQNVYAKAGVSTRGAAALYAMERGLL
jgi:DNA-binding NarL/FixJ family response regulator